jgi:hypothetical protein
MKSIAVSSRSWVIGASSFFSHYVFVICHSPASFIGTEWLRDSPAAATENVAQPSFRGWGLAETVQPMAETQNRVPPEHAGTGMAHDHLHLLAPVALITMHRAVGAGGLAGPKPAILQPRGGIVQQSLTLRAKRGPGVVAVAAMAPDHRGHRFPFPRQAPAGGEVQG